MGVGSPAPMAGWQRANVLAAAQFLRHVVSGSPNDAKAQVVYLGLLEVLEPARRTIRQQRELSEAARESVQRQEKRAGRERRAANRRHVTLGPPTGLERRKAQHRRIGDRRSRS